MFLFTRHIILKLSDFFQEAYNQLKKTLASKWDFVVMQAEEQVIGEFLQTFMAYYGQFIVHSQFEHSQPLTTTNYAPTLDDFINLRPEWKKNKKVSAVYIGVQALLSEERNMPLLVGYYNRSFSIHFH